MTDLRPTVLAALLALSALSARPADALNLRATPSISLQTGWDSNILSAPRDEISDFLFYGRPGLMLSTDIAGSTVNVAGGFEIDRYLRHTELNTFTGMVNYALNVTRPLQVTSRLSVQPEARYVKTNNIYRRNELALQSASEVLSSASVTASRSEFREYAGGLRSIYRLGETLTLDARAIGIRQEFTSSTGPTGLKIWQGSLAVNSETSVQSYWGAFAEVSHYSFDTSEESDTYTAGLQKSFRLSESFTLGGRAGGSHWRNRRPAVGATPPAERSSWSPYGHLSLARDKQDFHGSIGAGYEIEGTGGFSTITRTVSAFVLAADQFAPRWWWNVYGAYRRNYTVHVEDDVDMRTWEGRLGARHAISESLNVTVSASQLWQRAFGTLGVDVTRTVALIGLDYSPMFTIF